MNNMKRAADEKDQLLELFLFSMESYHRAMKALPLSNGFLAFDGTSSTINRALGQIGTDEVALEVRTMLQRKYFQRGETLHVGRVIEALYSASQKVSDDITLIGKTIDELKDYKLESCSTNGEIRSGGHQNVDDLIYGVLLHADLDKAQRLASTPVDIRLLALKEYVVKREEILLLLETAIRKTGVQSLADMSTGCFPAIIRFSKTDARDKSIKKSPKWHNLAGRDIDNPTLAVYASHNCADDNLVLLVGIILYDLLMDDNPDVDWLKSVTAPWTWQKWGDFSQAASQIRTLINPGCSSRVRHDGGNDYAQVIIFQYVEKPFEISTPQLIKGLSSINLKKYRKRRAVTNLIIDGISTTSSQ